MWIIHIPYSLGRNIFLQYQYTEFTWHLIPFRDVSTCEQVQFSAFVPANVSETVQI